jgi:glycine oxidase
MGKRVADVVVIGAGIIGTSIAWRLAQAGYGVIILEAGAVGGEASWAGAGMLAPGGEIEHRTPWSDFALESLRLYPQFISDLQQESGCAIDYQRLGAVELAFTADELQQLETRAAAQQSIGIVSERLDGAGLRELAPLATPDAVGARFFPGDEIVDPRHVTAALATACRLRGVNIEEQCPVASVWLGDGFIDVESARKPVRAARAVLAAGAWSGSIAVHRAGARVPIPSSFPLKGHLIGYRLAPGSLGPIVRHAETYVLQRANGFTIAGSSVENVGFDRSIDSTRVDDIRRRAAGLLPCLANAGPPESWIGFRPGADGLELQVRRFESTGLWLSYGHFRNGILLAPATAEHVSREIIASLETGSISSGGSH